MKTGVLNRTYSNVKKFFKHKESLIKSIAILLSIVIAFVLIVVAINETNTFGGLKEWYTYREDVYEKLTSILEENIVNDPYADLQKLSDTNIIYTCKYYSENQSWEVRISEGHRWISADISYIDEKMGIEVTHSGKIEYFAAVIITHVSCIVFVAVFVFALLALVFVIIWAIFKLICLLERLIIFLKNKPKRGKNTT